MVYRKYINIDIESCENVDKYILFHVKHYELLLLITSIARRIYGLYAFLICIFIYRRKKRRCRQVCCKSNLYVWLYAPKVPVRSVFYNF